VGGIEFDPTEFNPDRDSLINAKVVDALFAALSYWDSTNFFVKDARNKKDI
jgi:hypothetical protein